MPRSCLLLTFLTFAFFLPSLVFAQEETAQPILVVPVQLFPHYEQDELVGILAVARVDQHDYIGVYFPIGPVATTTLQYLDYTYDALGNITKLVDQSGTNGYGTTDFVYDNLYRLTSASSTLAVIADWLQTFTHDSLGNLTNKSDVGNYTYGGTNFANPHAATTIGGTNYTYDNAGNLLTSSNGTATTTNTWNYRNRLTDTNDGKGASATTTHYAYDENDQRVVMEVKSSGATTTTKYFNQYYETSTQGSNSTTTTNIYLPDGTLLATVEGNGSATTTSVIHTDHLGGTNVVSTEGGSQRQLVNYYPYGDLRQNEQPASGFNDKRKAIGQYYDDATSLNYYNARYMSGSRGQFTSQDPVARDIGMMGNMAGYILDVNQLAGEFNQTALLSNPQLLNSYSYAGNNPITKKDPSGKFLQYLAGLLLPNVAYAPAPGEEGQSNGNLENGIFVAGFAVPGSKGEGAVQNLATKGVQEVNKGAQVLVNKLAGDAFRDKVAQFLKEVGKQVQTEVTKMTPFGPRRVDIEVRDASGSLLGGVETKVGTSRYLPSQQQKDAFLNQQGYPVNVVRDQLKKAK